MPKKQKTFTTKIIKKGSETTIIEVTPEGGYPSRGYVPTETIHYNGDDPTVEPDVIEAMPMFGLPWEEIIVYLAKENLPFVVAGEMRKAGIYTLSELTHRQNDVQRILQVALGFYLGRLNELAHAYTKE